ncbi:hypothetical protein [Agromyces sp. ZXT2-6]|uniref:hypothetical protein n=1 Tax=Agromyces sp. ZXT2-6 TaxID=3461153 RepID=UPI004054A422
MAFAVNGVYRHADLTMNDLEAQLGSWSVAARELVRPTLERIADVIAAEPPHPPAHEGLRHELSAFVSNLLGGASVGSPATP